VPIALIPDYLAQLRSALLRVAPGCRESVFGHLGDGNLHVTILPPRGVSTMSDPSLPAILSEAVLGPAQALGGSVSAEHGIGSKNIVLLERSEPPVALSLMRLLKQALDPFAIMNPGKVLADHLTPGA